jgi:hypothetical protein
MKTFVSVVKSVAHPITPAASAEPGNRKRTPLVGRNVLCHYRLRIASGHGTGNSARQGAADVGYRHACGGSADSLLSIAG